MNLEGKKEVLGLYLSESEGANFWLGVLTDLHNRGVQDILIAIGRWFNGIPGAIQAIYPNTESAVYCAPDTQLPALCRL